MAHFRARLPDSLYEPLIRNSEEASVQIFSLDESHWDYYIPCTCITRDLHTRSLVTPIDDFLDTLAWSVKFKLICNKMLSLHQLLLLVLYPLRNLLFQIKDGDSIANRTNDTVAIWTEKYVSFPVNRAQKVGKLKVK